MPIQRRILEGIAEVVVDLPPVNALKGVSSTTEKSLRSELIALRIRTVLAVLLTPSLTKSIST